MHLHWHLTHFICPLTPSHFPLMSLRSHLTLLLAHKCLSITLYCSTSPINILALLFNASLLSSNAVPQPFNTFPSTFNIWSHFNCHHLKPILRPLLRLLPFNAFPSPINASAMPLHRPLLHLHRHLTHFIHPLPPSHRPLTSLRRHLTLLLAHKCLPITL